MIDRRTAMRWTAAVALALRTTGSTYALTTARPHPVNAQGYGLDPNLVEPVTPWPRTLTPSQARAIRTLCDCILPAEGDLPAATAIGIHEMIDEWVSAPYPQQRADRQIILAGLDWLDRQAKALGASDFTAASADAQREILSILDRSAQTPSGFYAKIRQLVIGGYYTTAQGFADIGYIGNVPLAAYPAPSVEVEKALQAAYRQLGLSAAPGV
jgi:hypothetical protein